MPQTLQGQGFRFQASALLLVRFNRGCLGLAELLTKGAALARLRGLMKDPLPNLYYTEWPFWARKMINDPHAYTRMRFRGLSSL